MADAAFRTDGTLLICDRCDAKFPARTFHDCTPTRKEFAQLQADLRSLARSYLEILNVKQAAKDLRRARSSVHEIERIAGVEPGVIFTSDWE